MKNLLVILFLLPFIAKGQELTMPAKFLTSYTTDKELYIGTDAFGALYTVQDNEFHKRKEGVLLKFKALSLGDITKIDLQNPLQIVLFYKRFNTVVLVDNQLNETKRINFSAVPEPLIAETIGLASQNRLWLYDINTQRLGLCDLAQNAFRPLTPPFTDTIKHYQSDYNFFYWVDATGKCFACNVFGKVSFLGNVADYEKIQLVSATEALVQKDNALYLHNLQDGTRKRIELVEKTFDGFQYSAQILSIFTGGEINQYKITLSQ